jgi:hypothetical protein
MTKPRHAVPEDKPPAPDDDFDFDLAALRANPQQSLLQVEEGVLSIPVRKPKTDEFFRTREEFVQDLPLLQVEISERKELFWVAPSFRSHLMDRLGWFRVYACINRNATVFLWPISLNDSAIARRWRDTALVIAEEALESWRTKITREGCYAPGRARGDLPEPVWPTMTYDEIVRMAFSADDRTIRSADHYVIRLINGEV